MKLTSLQQRALDDIITALARTGTSAGSFPLTGEAASLVGYLTTIRGIKKGIEYKGYRLNLVEPSSYGEPFIIRYQLLQPPVAAQAPAAVALDISALVQVMQAMATTQAQIAQALQRMSEALDRLTQVADTLAKLMDYVAK